VLLLNRDDLIFSFLLNVLLVTPCVELIVKVLSSRVLSLRLVIVLILVNHQAIVLKVNLPRADLLQAAVLLIRMRTVLDLERILLVLQFLSVLLGHVVILFVFSIATAATFF
jgi:hypothetical protein